MIESLKNWNAKIVKIVHIFTIMHKGWEMDNTAWIVELKDGRQKVVFSSNGMLYFAKKPEIEKKIRAYEDGLAGLRDARSVVCRAVSGKPR